MDPNENLLRDFIRQEVAARIPAPAPAPAASAAPAGMKITPAGVMAAAAIVGLGFTLITVLSNNTDGRVADEVQLTRQMTNLAASVSTISAGVNGNTENIRRLTDTVNDIAREPRFTFDDYKRETAAVRRDLDRALSMLEARTDFMQTSRSADATHEAKFVTTDARLAALEAQSHPNRAKP